jgi:hypothetical protein
MIVFDISNGHRKIIEDYFAAYDSGSGAGMSLGLD